MTLNMRDFVFGAIIAVLAAVFEKFVPDTKPIWPLIVGCLFGSIAESMR